MLPSSYPLSDPFMTLLRGEIYDNASIYGFCVALDYGLGTRNVILRLSRPNMRSLFLSFTHAALKKRSFLVAKEQRTNLGENLRLRVFVLLENE